MKKPKKTKVILDTNFFLVPYKYKLDIFFEVDYLIRDMLGKPEFIISKGIINELKALAGKRGRSALEARFALKIIEQNKEKLKIVNSIASVDGWILRYAKYNKAITCTDDIKLKNLLKKKGLRVIMVKSKTRVDFV